MPKRDLPAILDVVPPPYAHDIRRLSIQSQSGVLPSSINEPQPSTSIESSRHDDYYRRFPNHPTVQMPRAYEHGLPPILQGEELKRSSMYESTMSAPAQSPYPSSASSVFGSLQSPMPSQPSSRTLPSPPGLQYSRNSRSDYNQYSPTTSEAAQASHLQDLQHQISTKSLALQTLQREHDQLLAAFSRAQVRSSALEKKSQVSDLEINSLSEDKIRLQQQVETLEGQVEELMKTRDEVNQQSSADGAQWRQIMAMSSQLQIKGAEEARRYRLERDAWEREKAGLQKRIDEFESGKDRLPGTRAVASSMTPVANDEVLNSGSIESLREEVVKLRRRCEELESMLQDLEGEAEQIDNAITTMENVRKSLSGKKRRQQDN
jgi:hypothetical protein